MSNNWNIPNKSPTTGNNPMKSGLKNRKNPKQEEKQTLENTNNWNILSTPEYTDEEKIKISEYLKDFYKTKRGKEKALEHSATMKEYWAELTLEEREEYANITSERYLDPSYKENWHQANIKRWEDPDYHKKISKTLINSFSNLFEDKEWANKRSNNVSKARNKTVFPGKCMLYSPGNDRLDDYDKFWEQWKKTGSVNCPRVKPSTVFRIRFKEEYPHRKRASKIRKILSEDGIDVTQYADGFTNDVYFKSWPWLLDEPSSRYEFESILDAGCFLAEKDNREGAKISNRKHFSKNTHRGDNVYIRPFSRGKDKKTEHVFTYGPNQGWFVKWEFDKEGK
ncbi:hypothetical protein N9C44_01800 [bacterium]|nr:hypothetical protein [bacterium]